MQTYQVTRVRAVNVDTGHCIIDVEGVGERITGKITDPALDVPNNVYTTALNSQGPCVVQAKAVRKEGEIKRLYISNATP